MNYKPGTKIRFDGRFNKLTVCGQARHHNARRMSKKPLPVWFKVLVIITILTGLWGLCEDRNNVQPTAKAQETQEDSEPLSIQPRDTLGREGRSEVAPRKLTIDELLDKYFPNEPMVKKIMDCESGFNPKAIGDTNTKYPSIGLFQIRMLPGRNLDKHWLEDEEYNIAYARTIYDNAGGTFKKDWVICSKIAGEK